MVGIVWLTVLHAGGQTTLDNATGRSYLLIKPEVTQSLDITLSRGEFINIDGPGGIIGIMPTAAPASAHWPAAFGCTGGWHIRGRLHCHLILPEHVSGHARTLLSSATYAR